MSSEQSPTNVPPMDSLALKAALRKRGIYQTHIARECGVDQGLVSHVLAGTKHGPKARVVMRYIAEQLGYEVEVLFPNYERRRPFEDAAA